MNKIFVATSTLAQFSDESLSILEENRLKVCQNNLGRKLNEEELLELVGVLKRHKIKIELNKINRIYK